MDLARPEIGRPRARRGRDRPDGPRGRGNWHGGTGLAVRSASDARLFAWADSDNAAGVRWNGLEWEESRTNWNHSPFDTSSIGAATFLSRNVRPANAFVQIPSTRVVELGTQIEL